MAPAVIPAPVVIIGAARSGTSITAALVAAHGYYTGECRPASPKNPKGFFENHRLLAIRQKQPVPESQVRNALVTDGWPGGPWLVKHGLQGWRTWLDLDPQYVCVRRDLEATLDSQMRWQPATKTCEQRRNMIQQQHAQLDTIRDGYGGIDFWPGPVISGDVSGLRRLMEALCTPYNPEALLVIDRSLWGRYAA